MSQHGVQAQAAAAALSGDRQFLNIQCVNTGDAPGNLMLACLAAIAACQTSPGETVEVMEYLAKRFQRAADQTKSMYGLQQALSGKMAAGTIASPSWLAPEVTPTGPFYLDSKAQNEAKTFLEGLTK